MVRTPKRPPSTTIEMSISGIWIISPKVPMAIEGKMAWITMLAPKAPPGTMP